MSESVEILFYDLLQNTCFSWGVLNFLMKMRSVCLCPPTPPPPNILPNKVEEIKSVS